MNNQHDKRYIEEDEIDLRELFKTLWDKKVFILVFTFLVTTASVVYVNFKNPIPIYQGSVMVEIGEIKNLNGNISYFDNGYSLKNITEKFSNVSINLITGTGNLLNISATNKNKEKIQEEIKNAVSFMLERHKSKIYLYDKYIMTKQVGEILINNTPINKPKKKLIVVVAFVTGFILSIFIVFFMQFIRSFKKKEEKQIEL